MFKIVKFIGWAVLPSALQIYSGWIISKFWLWFIVTGFDQKPISVLTAIGLSFFISLIIYRPRKDDDYDLLEQILSLFIFQSMMLACGWVLYQFM